MKAKIKRLLVLILVSAMIINSDMLYLAMGIEMLFVNAAENEDLEEIKQDNQENLQDEPEDGQQENSQEAPEMNTPVQNPPKFMVSNRATSIIPTTAAGLQGMGTTFTLSTYQDLINLQKLSQTTSLEGYTFTFLKILDEENQAQWNFSKASVDGAGYIGIGNEAYPFKGTLNTYVNGMVCTINKPVCNYVCTGATFEGFNFNSNNAKASLAEYLVTSEGSTVKGVQLKNITVGGTIGSSSTSVSGGLFAYIENKTTSPIELVFTENAADSVYSVKMTAGVHGTYAGGIVGVVNSDAASTGSVSIISKLSVVTGTVNGYG